MRFVWLTLGLVVAPAAAHADAAPTCSRLAIELVIDRSGSMTGMKLDNAKAASAAAVDKLGTTARRFSPR